MASPEKPSPSGDRDVQDEIIRYLADGEFRAQGSANLPLTPADAQKAERFARFLIRRYYRDRLARGFRTSRLLAEHYGRLPEETVDQPGFGPLLETGVLGSFLTSRIVAQLAKQHLMAHIPELGPWWWDMLRYDIAYFMQLATSDPGAPSQLPRRGTSAMTAELDWYLPQVVGSLRARQEPTPEMERKWSLLFSRTHGGRVYVMEIDSDALSLFEAVDGKRARQEIIHASGVRPSIAEPMLADLERIGAVILPQQAVSPAT
ncbi:MAG TPA: hypothetical protein VFA60_14750 [Terriglobales bacterium]|nr:hypothetical protein [Terriglobales bacterium]